MFGNPCFWTFFQTFWPKNRVFRPINRKLFLNLFPNYFCEIFASSKSLGFFRKNFKLWKPNISKTCENKKFRNFCLTQGLSNDISLSLSFVFIHFHLRFVFEAILWIQIVSLELKIPPFLSLRKKIILS